MTNVALPDYCGACERIRNTLFLSPKASLQEVRFLLNDTLAIYQHGHLSGSRAYALRASHSGADDGEIGNPFDASDLPVGQIIPIHIIIFFKALLLLAISRDKSVAFPPFSLGSISTSSSSIPF